MKIPDGWQAWAASSGPACIRWHESRDNYATDTGNGYFGAAQWLLSTWYSVGGTGYPNKATPAEQNYRMWLLWKRDGWSPWSTAPGCGL